MRGFRAEMGGRFWHEGQAERSGHLFRWEAKVYPEGSACGINGGRVSKLWIAERGWCTCPLTPAAKAFVDELLEHFK